jgi:hypothetical protein
MSKSPEEATEELQDALEFGRCRLCDGIKCDGSEGYCKCCANCCMPDESSCSCCPHCRELLNICRCMDRLNDIWNADIECLWCSKDSSLFGPKEWHCVGKPCPDYCKYCKEMVCICCTVCRTNPCIFCTGCGELRIKCKCLGAKILSHYMRHAVWYHNYQQDLREQFFPINTAALLTVKSDDL